VVANLIGVLSRPLWTIGIDVMPPQVYLYSGNLYRVVIGHRTQADWPPDTTVNLFTRYYEPTETPAWVQPTGAQDAWPLGARVTHAGHLWTSLIPANVWEPGVVGSEALWRCEDCAPITAEWVTNHDYVGDNTAGAGNGDVVIYVPNGHRYRCRQTHRSILTWAPPLVQALWLDLGPA
jgi:hypothetical protein